MDSTYATKACLWPLYVVWVTVCNRDAQTKARWICGLLFERARLRVLPGSCTALLVLGFLLPVADSKPGKRARRSDEKRFCDIHSAVCKQVPSDYSDKNAEAFGDRKGDLVLGHGVQAPNPSVKWSWNVWQIEVDWGMGETPGACSSIDR